MHRKLTKYGRCCMQKPPTPTKNPIAVKKKTLLGHIRIYNGSIFCTFDPIISSCLNLFENSELHTQKLLVVWWFILNSCYEYAGVISNHTTTHCLMVSDFLGLRIRSPNLILRNGEFVKQWPQVLRLPQVLWLSFGMVSYMQSLHCCRPFCLSTFVGMMWRLTISGAGMSPRIGPEVHFPPEQCQIFLFFIFLFNKVRLVDMIVHQMQNYHKEVIEMCSNYKCITASSLRATLS